MSLHLFSYASLSLSGRPSFILQTAEVKIINDTVCDMVIEGQVTSRMLCSGFLAGGVDACQVHTHTLPLLQKHMHILYIYAIFFFFSVFFPLALNFIGMTVFSLQYFVLQELLRFI